MLENHADTSEIQKILVKPFQKCKKKWIWAKFYCASFQLKIGGFNPHLLWRKPWFLTFFLLDLFSPSKCCNMDLNFSLNFRFFHLGQIIFHTHKPISYLNLPKFAQNQGMSKFQMTHMAEGLNFPTCRHKKCSKRWPSGPNVTWSSLGAGQEKGQSEFVIRSRARACKRARRPAQRAQTRKIHGLANFKVL